MNYILEKIKRSSTFYGVGINLEIINALLV